MAIAMSSPNYGWMAWIGLFPFFLAIQVLSPLRAGIGGALWGLCLYVFSILLLRGPISPSVSSLLLLTAVPAVYAYLGARLTRRLGFCPFLLALGWIGVELALKPLGRPDGMLGLARGDSAFIQTMAELFGYVIVAFLIAFANVVLLSIASTIQIKLIRSHLFMRSDEFSGWFPPHTLSYAGLSAADSFRPRAPPRPLNY
ncbi:hypothetical protein ACFLQW_00975 [Candidatus Zixiibacteriota bacterium]